MMDREQADLQRLGFFGIFRESFKIIFSSRKIFSQIALALVLPPSFIFLAHIQIAQILFARVLGDRVAFEGTPLGATSQLNLSHIDTSKWAAYWLFEITYFVFLLIFSLLSTAAVVYTIACIYTAKVISFRKVMGAVPKIWRRLLVTFLWSSAILFVYNLIAGVLFIFLGLLLGRVSSAVEILIVVVFLVFYISGLLYITIVWNLASVVSVLEETYGIKALIKSNSLMKGKMGVAVAFFITLGLSFGGIQFVFELFVVLGWPFYPGISLVIGIGCLFTLLLLILICLVFQTVLYFVCKAYHRETIDKPALSEHLEVYAWYYGPLKTPPKDVQMEQTQA